MVGCTGLGRRVRMMAGLAALGLALAGAGPALAADTMDPFLGQWTGRAARTDLGPGLNGTPSEVRDLMLGIVKDGDGKVEITALAATGGGDPLGDAKFRMSTFVFRPVAPGAWSAQESCADLKDAPCAWAHVMGNTLVTTAVGRLDGGAIEVQSARRTLESGGMSIAYSRMVDGRIVRTIEGRLVRQAP